MAQVVQMGLRECVVVMSTLAGRGEGSGWLIHSCVSTATGGKRSVCTWEFPRGFAAGGRRERLGKRQGEMKDNLVTETLFRRPCSFSVCNLLPKSLRLHWKGLISALL